MGASHRPLEPSTRAPAAASGRARGGSVEITTNGILASLSRRCPWTASRGGWRHYFEKNFLVGGAAILTVLPGVRPAGEKLSFKKKEKYVELRR
jgi:hypothetical protein